MSTMHRSLFGTNGLRMMNSTLSDSDDERESPFREYSEIPSISPQYNDNSVVDINEDEDLQRAIAESMKGSENTQSNTKDDMDYQEENDPEERTPLRAYSNLTPRQQSLLRKQNLDKLAAKKTNQNNKQTNIF